LGSSIDSDSLIYIKMWWYHSNRKQLKNTFSSFPYQNKSKIISETKLTRTRNKKPFGLVSTRPAECLSYQRSITGSTWPIFLALLPAQHSGVAVWVGDLHLDAKVASHMFFRMKGVTSHILYANHTYRMPTYLATKWGYTAANPEIGQSPGRSDHKL
jgi:hypothetical protein